MPSQTVPCTTYLVQPGFFDIFFPTDFDTLREMYSLVMSSGSPTTAAQATPFSPSSGHAAPASLPTSARAGLSPDYFSPSSPSSRRYGGDSTGLGPSGRSLQVVDHGDFLEEWGETDMTRLGDGSNPLVETYQNAKFIY